MPYQTLPLATKLIMSTADAVAVMVGAVPPGHLTEVNVAVVIPVAELVRMRIKLLPAVAVGIVNVQGVEAVNVAVRTVPFVNARVEVAIVGVVSNTILPVPVTAFVKVTPP